MLGVVKKTRKRKDEEKGKENFQDLSPIPFKKKKLIHIKNETF